MGFAQSNHRADFSCFCSRPSGIESRFPGANSLRVILQDAVNAVKLFQASIFAKGRASQTALGNLERSVMEVLWSRGESSVREVADKLKRPLAYTTVMTTLDRLYKKNLLLRRKEGRAFRYLPRITRGDWERGRADELFAEFLGGPRPSRDLLISCFIEAAGQYDEALLDELEGKIRMKRKELGRRRT